MESFYKLPDNYAVGEQNFSSTEARLAAWLAAVVDFPKQEMDDPRDIYALYEDSDHQKVLSILIQEGNSVLAFLKTEKIEKVIIAGEDITAEMVASEIKHLDYKMRVTHGREIKPTREEHQRILAHILNEGPA